MKKNTQPPAGVSKSNVTASAKAATTRAPQQQSSERRLDASAAPTPSASISARYIDSRLKQFCLR